MLPSRVKGLSYVEVLTHLSMSRPLCWSFSVVKQLELLECMFWEILQKLPELYISADVLLTPQDGILSTGCTCKDCQLKSDDN